jgi:hypothetical protein
MITDALKSVSVCNVGYCLMLSGWKTPGRLPLQEKESPGSPICLPMPASAAWIWTWFLFPATNRSRPLQSAA